MYEHNFGVKNLPELLALVDKNLKNFATESIPGLNRLLHAKGKRYRPSLIIAIAFHCGKEINETVINAATAIELIHLASLIHDDIMDKADKRWSKITINAKEGNEIAILAGDYLLANGCALAYKVSNKVGEIISETIVQLCMGQAQELADRYNTKRSIESLLLSTQGKTSSMFIAACTLGGLLAQLKASELEILRRFSNNFGIYYQIMDDVRDCRASTMIANKSLGNDIREGNYTLPIIMSLAGPNQRELVKLLKNIESNYAQILKLLQEDNSLEHAMEKAKKFKQKAYMVLEKLDYPNLVKALKSFCN
jgi:heptaprenyl diphosphate synthase